MAFVPPRTSYTMSPHLRTPDGETNRQNSLSLVPITTKDSSPAPSAFSNDRSPLSSIGANNLGFGIRQRRQTQGPEGPSTFFKGGDSFKGPPRASLTMSMGGTGTSGAMVAPLVDSTKTGMGSQIVDIRGLPNDDNWVLVFGFGNNIQREEVIRKFKSMGNVTDVKIASGSKNWIALRYDSTMAFEKAAGERDFQTSDGCFCAVRRLTNSQEFFLEQRRAYSSVVSQNPSGEFKTDETISLFPRNKVDHGANDADTEMEEKDILLVAGTEKGVRRGKTCCESFMGWIYGW